MKTTVIRLTPDLHKALKHKALVEGRKLEALAADAVREFLAKGRK